MNTKTNHNSNANTNTNTNHICDYFDTVTNCFNLLLTDINISIPVSMSVPMHVSTSTTTATTTTANNNNNNNNNSNSSNTSLDSLSNNNMNSNDNSNSNTMYYQQRDIYSMTIDEKKQQSNYINGYIQLYNILKTLHTAVQSSPSPTDTNPNPNPNPSTISTVNSSPNCTCEHYQHYHSYILDTWYICTVFYKQFMNCTEQYDLVGLCRELSKYCSNLSEIKEYVYESSSGGSSSGSNIPTINAPTPASPTAPSLIQWQYVYIYRLHAILYCITQYYIKYYALYSWCHISIHNLVDCLCKQRLKCFVCFPFDSSGRNNNNCDTDNSNDINNNTIKALSNCLSKLDEINENITNIKYKQSATTIISSNNNNNGGSSFTGGSSSTSTINKNTISRTIEHNACHPLRSIKNN